MDEGLTSVIVVTADSGECARPCVERALQSDVPVEVIVVDNGSSDGHPEAMARALQHEPRVTVILNHANLGFGKAVNRGVAASQGRYVLILNPDCHLERDTLRQLRQALEANLHAGLVGAVITNEQGIVDPASRRVDPYLDRVLATVRGTDEQLGEEGVHVPGPMPEDITVEEAISGALMLLRRDAFDRIHGIDTGYFLHFEDLDLCRRLRDAGYQVLLNGAVHVVHTGGTSSRHRPLFVSRHKHAGMWRWFRKFDPAARNPFKATLVWCGLWAHFVLEAGARLTGRHSRY